MFWFFIDLYSELFISPPIRPSVSKSDQAKRQSWNQFDRALDRLVIQPMLYELYICLSLVVFRLFIHKVLVQNMESVTFNS